MLFGISATVGEPLNTGSSLQARDSHPEPEDFCTACYKSISSVFMLSYGGSAALALNFLLLYRSTRVISLKITAVRICTPSRFGIILHVFVLKLWPGLLIS